MIKEIVLVGVALGIFTCSGDELQWYKGNTHTHTFWSDGDDFPEMVVDWYKNHGYDFLVLSDHNILSRGEKWKALRADQANVAIDKAEKRWGRGHVKTRIVDGAKEVRLLPLNEVRDLLEEPGKFIMIEGLEMTTSREGLAVHTNPMNVSELLGVERLSERIVEQELEIHSHLVNEHSHATSKPVFWQVNHPNYRFSITGEQLADVALLDGVEIMNSSSNCFNLGDGSRPSVERIWDIANTIRLKNEGLPPIFGTATDDTHDYHLENPVVNGPGTAWVMVRSKSLTADSITGAMKEGDFYSSTGVVLKRMDFNASDKTFTVEVDAEPGVQYEIEFKGSLSNVSLAHEHVPDVVDEKGIEHPVTANYLDQNIGKTFMSKKGTRATYRLKGNELFVRAVVHSSASPYFKYDEYSDFEKKAWTQPVGWKID
jgi:hypothetical protein